jgi:hypothetical protein
MFLHSRRIGETNMVGNIVGVLLGGYVALRICIALIPSITGLDGDVSTATGGTGILFDILTMALWMLPLAAVAGIIIWAAQQISHWGGGRGR